jgi:hypothetical protein
MQIENQTASLFFPERYIFIAAGKVETCIVASNIFLFLQKEQPSVTISCEMRVVLNIC